MPFAATTLGRVISMLTFPASTFYEERIQESFNHVEARVSADEIVASVEADIATYENLEGQLNTQASRGSLVKADVLAWEGGALGGVRDEMTRLRRKVARLLLLEHLLPTQQSGVKLIRRRRR